jgi:hypothetical protein
MYPEVEARFGIASRLAEQGVDTREKIKTFEELRSLLGQGAWTILAGAFDPLTPDQAARVQSCVSPGRRLLVVIQSSSDELLDSASRVVLMAALRAVDAVMIETSDEWRVLAARNTDIRVIEDRDASLRYRREFEQLVIGRHTTSASSWGP